MRKILVAILSLFFGMMVLLCVFTATVHNVMAERVAIDSNLLSALDISSLLILQENPDLIIENKTIDLNLHKGWSMISLPVLPENPEVSELFPQAYVVYEYEPGYGYKRVQKLKVGQAYWILLNEEHTYTLTGQTINQFILPVNVDSWYMVGGCSSSALASITNGNIGVIYNYIQGVGCQRLSGEGNFEPGKGYWVLVNNVVGKAEIKIERRIFNDIKYLETMQAEIPDNYIEKLKSFIQNNPDSYIRDRGLFTLTDIAIRKNEPEKIIGFLKELAMNEEKGDVRTSAFANIDLIRAHYPSEKRGFLELSVVGAIKKGNTIKLIARISSTVDIEEEVIVGIPSLHNNIELLSNREAQKVYLRAEEPHDIIFDLKLKETGTYYIPVIFSLSLNRIDYEKIHKDVYIEVSGEYSHGGWWDIVNDTDGFSTNVRVDTHLSMDADQTEELMNESKLIAVQQSSINQSYVVGQGSYAGQQSSVIQTYLGGQSFSSLCPSGCECLTGPEAENKFGSGSLKTCSDTVCGYGWVGDLKLEKYCYSQITLDECIDTDGGKNYDVKGSIMGYVDQCSEFSHPPEVLKEYYAEVVNGKCEVYVDYHDCDSICENGRCLPPTCDDWVQNQGEEGVDCGGPCSNPCLCPSGCKCVTGVEAEIKFGQGQYTTCTSNACGYQWVGDLYLPKYCYKKIQSYDCIDTDGGADIYVQGSAPGCEDTCFSDRVLQECIVNQTIDGCEVYSSPWECEGLCQDGACMAPTCDDGIQNQDEVAVDCSIDSIYADCDSCCLNGIQDYDEEGVDCGGSNCTTPCGWVEVRGRILYEDFDSATDTGGIFNPVRYGKFYLRLCNSHPCTSPTHQALWITDSMGNFSFMVPKSNFKSAFIRLGHEDDDDVYMFNYAVKIARDLDDCDETVWWNSGSIEIPPSGNINFGELRIGRDTKIDFQGYWQEETDAALCGYGSGGTIDGGSGYFNIADAILYARQYADARRSDNDAIGYVDVQWPDASDSSHYGSCHEEITLTQQRGFADYTIIHEYGHYLQDAIGTNDDYWGGSDHTFCTHGKDEEFAWKEGFAEYFGTIVPHNYPALSNPINLYTRLESPYCFENDDADCCEWPGKESEATVAGVLWDIADDPAFTGSVNESFDTINGRETLIFNIFDDELDNGDSIAADAPDLCEFIEQGLNCRASSDAEKDAFWDIWKHFNVICSTVCDD